MLHLLLLITFAAHAGPVAAQATTSAEAITAENVTRHIKAIAHDSMTGRDTPSRGLELTAQYIANQFKQLGLIPSGDSGTWFQRYRILAEADFGSAGVSFAVGGITSWTSFGGNARLEGLTLPAWPMQGAGVILVAGRHTAQSLRQADVGDKIVLYIPPAGIDSAARQQVIDHFLAANTSRGVVIPGGSACLLTGISRGVSS